MLAVFRDAQKIDMTKNRGKLASGARENIGRDVYGYTAPRAVWENRTAPHRNIPSTRQPHR